jgi:hypothetical protein
MKLNLSLKAVSYAKGSCSTFSYLQVQISTADNLLRSFRYSNCGKPLLNLDVGFSAFLAAGPALEVIAKILQRTNGGTRGGRGGYLGGIQRPMEISELNEREIVMVKNKLRGAKVSSLDIFFFVQLMAQIVLTDSSTVPKTTYNYVHHQPTSRKYHLRPASPVYSKEGTRLSGIFHQWWKSISGFSSSITVRCLRTSWFSGKLPMIP